MEDIITGYYWYYMMIPQTVCPHWRILTVGVKAGAQSGLRHFSCKFPYKVALVKSCNCAFPLRRLAQNVCPRSGLILGQGISPVNFCIKWLFWCLLWHVDTDFDCAGSHKMNVCVPGSIWGAAFFSVNFRVKSWRAFRPRRLAHNVCLHLNLGRGIFPVNFRIGS